MRNRRLRRWVQSLFLAVVSHACFCQLLLAFAFATNHLLYIPLFTYSFYSFVLPQLAGFDKQLRLAEAAISGHPRLCLCTKNHSLIIPLFLLTLYSFVLVGCVR
jgi:hypothetical protein